VSALATALSEMSKGSIIEMHIALMERCATLEKLVDTLLAQKLADILMIEKMVGVLTAAKEAP